MMRTLPLFLLAAVTLAALFWKMSRDAGMNPVEPAVPQVRTFELERMPTLVPVPAPPARPEPPPGLTSRRTARAPSAANPAPPPVVVPDDRDEVLDVPRVAVEAASNGDEPNVDLEGGDAFDSGDEDHLEIVEVGPPIDPEASGSLIRRMLALYRSRR